MPTVLSVDIGSTWTKGALFDLDRSAPRCLARADSPTTVHDLAQGVAVVVGRLGIGRAAGKGTVAFSRHEERASPACVEEHGLVLPDGVGFYYSSSAKGGLAIAAVGIVPDLTLAVAKLAAASAGGKIVAHYAYRLTAEQVVELERVAPDIVILCGGTDGGNEQYNLHNARMLAAAKLSAVILYAGNAAIRGEIRGLLAGKELAVVENLMPEIGTLCIEPARARIQEIFLERIVEGKGLRELSARAAGRPKPTPRAVFDLLERIAQAFPEWNDLLLVDLGGATTDFYSCCESFRAQPDFVLRGLREPKLKRSVEGDLGMRVNARWALETGRDFVAQQLAIRGIPAERLAAFVAQVSADKDYLPACPEEEACDQILAGACLYHALLRHAGSVEESYAAHGKIFIQRGKDLRGVTKWIASGGYLARQPSAALPRCVLAAIGQDGGGMRLVPQSAEFYADAEYLFPLLGNLADDFPEAAARLAVEHLVRID